jgi:hypothetical protein
MKLVIFLLGYSQLSEISKKLSTVIENIIRFPPFFEPNNLNNQYPEYKQNVKVSSSINVGPARMESLLKLNSHNQ